LKRLVQIEPLNAVAWQNLAVGHFARGEYALGVHACQQALQCDPHNTTVLYNLALAYEHLRDYEQGLRWCRLGLKQEPTDLSLQRLEIRLRFLRFRSRVKERFLSLFRRSAR
jgi:tetratricopeptide (TPR) repeat protein